MTNDLYFIRSLGCQYLGTDYDSRTHKGASPYCGCKSLVGDSVYCAEHYDLIYVKGSALRKRNKDTARANAVRQLESDFNAAVEELEQEGWDVYSKDLVEDGIL